MISGVTLTPLKVIPTDGGAVLHGLRGSDSGFGGFGEAYFSRVNHGSIRGWKRHSRMTMNLIVPYGEIRLVVIDDRADSNTNGEVNEFLLSTTDNYQRLTVAPGLWMGFQGMHQPDSLLLNIASIEHDPDEVEQKPLERFSFAW